MKYIKTLPLASELDGDKLPVALWQSDENVCELKPEVSTPEEDCQGTMFFGTEDEREPKFCAYHFFIECTSGDGKSNYKLVANE